MRGFELVKREDHWALYNEDGHKIAATIPGCNSKLSLKNCEAIANGYDLDELSFDYADKIGILHTTLAYSKHFEAGFQKALELLGDKKFSEEDISKAINFGVHVEAGNIDIDYKRYGTKENQFIQSLQQTEWDVEICYENDCYINPTNCSGTSFDCKLCTQVIPKLDADGCLILKRI